MPMMSSDAKEAVDLPAELCGALRIETVKRRAFVPRNIVAAADLPLAGGAACGLRDVCGFRRLFHHLQNARDDVAGLNDPDLVPDANVELANVIPVAQGRGGNGCAADLNRVEGGRRHHAARVPDAHGDAANDGFCPFGFKLERDLAFRALVGLAQGKLFSDAVQLDDDAVNPVRQRGPVVLGFQVPVPNRLGGPGETRGGFKSHRPHGLSLFGLRGAQRPAAAVKSAEGEHLKELALVAVFPARNAHAAIARVG